TSRLPPVHRVSDHSSRHHAKRYPAPIVVKLLCADPIHAQTWIEESGTVFQDFRHSVRSMSHAVAIARTLERMERGRVQSAAVARSTIASRLKVGVGTLENILRERVKSIDADLRDRLQA